MMCRPLLKMPDPAFWTYSDAIYSRRDIPPHVYLGVCCACHGFRPIVPAHALPRHPSSIVNLPSSEALRRYAPTFWQAWQVYGPLSIEMTKELMAAHHIGELLTK